jgi:N-acetylated-alpha-linked acidic dipeptidase
MEAGMRLGLVLVAGTALALATGAWAQAPGMTGFTEQSAAAQRAREASFDAQISPQAITERLKIMAAEPNHVGSPHDKWNAEYTLEQFKSWGWDAKIETFDVLFPTPLEVNLDLTGPKPHKATLTEPPIRGDVSSEQSPKALPAYVAYQGDGDVTAPLVYVNYGMPADYETLARMGIDVKGKIVIARYGGGWRGLKPKLAQEHGAVGCIIYSDPADDGYGEGPTYPEGSWRPDAGFQRGSVMDMPIHPGDPLTPGYGSVKGAKRLDRSEARTILKIPALPISYGDARHLLAALDGQTVPKSWRGGLPGTYQTGPGPAVVHLVVKSDWGQKTLYNVIATMKGKTQPEQWVVRGNHRDGWVMGAEDPLSGHVVMMEEAKAIGALAKAGWKPARTIVYASWDGEEQGLLGSTEWAETHAKELQDKAVVYINTDSSGRGVLDVDASYSTRRLLNEVAAEVIDPETGATARARNIASVQVRALSGDARDEIKAEAKAVAAGKDFAVAPMGSGSDYTPFVQHLGIASINLGYSGEDEGGVYHSLYDTFEHYQRFNDPGGIYQAALAKTVGRLVLRTADAEVAPLQFAGLAETVDSNVTGLKKLEETTRERAEGVNRLVDGGAYALADEPSKKWAPPARQDPGKPLDFKALDAAVAKLKASAAAYDAASAGAPALPAAQRARLNDMLQKAEQSLTDKRGLPGRPWFRHMIYAPGLLTGYGAKTIPGVREAIESRRWAEAQEFIGRTSEILDNCAAHLDRAAALIRS